MIFSYNIVQSYKKQFTITFEFKEPLFGVSK